jgi:hypothetical protein
MREKLLVRRPERREHLRDLGEREDNIRMDLRKHVGACESMWIGFMRLRTGSVGVLL